jgi:TPR repeat protein
LYGTNGYSSTNQKFGFSLLKSAADAGHSDAQFPCGRCLLDGKGCLRDEMAAFRYLQQSSEKSELNNQNAGCRLSAEGGNPNAQNIIGEALANGRGVAQDLVRAAKCFHLSAEQGNADGQYNFAVCLENGCGVAQDFVRAAEYFRLAAEQGNAHS